MNNKIKHIVVLICISIFYGSCESVDFGDTNDDPNGPTDAITSQLLTGAEASIPEDIITSTKGILFMQHLTEGQYPGDSRYTSLTASYDDFYTGPIQNLNEIIRINSDEELKVDAAIYGDNNNQIAVAKLLRAYYLQYLTDRWGALPWTEAFQGISFPKPTFNTQEELYIIMFTEVDEALALINVGNSGPSGDVILGGDMNRWIMFANTLKMVMALRISDVKPALAKTKFEETVASGKLIRSNDDNILYTYGTDDVSDSPWADRYKTREDFILSVTLVEALRTNIDPRLFKYAEPARDSISSRVLFPSGMDSLYVGAQNGRVNGDVPNYSFPPAAIIYEPDSPSPIFTSAQVKFSLAEAALKGWNVGSGTTASLFKEGIEDSMEYWGVSTDDIDAYTAAHTSATIADIAYEKWVALYLNGPELWAEWRRLDLPILTPSENAAVATIPVRDAYDSSVEDNNKANYDAINAIQGPDTRYTKLWWDVN